ncbi:MAG: carbonic anhydrase/acetyltransferase-like protein (isoleucine patch superfamily) [Rickettsiales bacterium]|jgi:carbonic anhydrase/acetyltransferase-like protein (isoleucine patch superfamily)
MTTILPNTIVAKGCLIGAGSILNVNTEPHMVYVGNPAKKVCPAAKIRLKDGTRNPAYPWINHFKRGYPEDVTKQWEKIINEENV